MKKLGLIINPIAGMGGSVGLKGTDGVLAEAIKRGAIPKSNDRTKIALKQIEPLKDDLIIYTGEGDMGENIARELGFQVEVFRFEKDIKDSNLTTSLSEALKINNVKLLLFAGGDGTARDIYNSIGTDITCLGIPAGVKIHSAVYAKTPLSAGNLAKLYLDDKIKKVQEVEVVDIDEDRYREGEVNTRLYGYLNIPSDKKFTQNQKSGTPMSESVAIESIGHEIVGRMNKDTYYLIGAGTTTRGIMQILGLDYTLIGVDLIKDGKLIAKDIYGSQILDIIKGKKTELIVTITGGQGFLFGRGNQQITPEIIKEIGKENITIVATKEKIFSLRGQNILIDTGDRELDAELEGYYKVTSSYRQSTVCKISVD